MTYAAIDTGATGAIAFLDDTPCSAPFNIAALPLQSVGKRKELDVRSLRGILIDEWEPIEQLTVIVEECSYHQPSHCAMRSQALSYGKLVAMLELKGIRFVAVQAQKWQKDLLGKLPAGTTKAAALGLARRLWPAETFVLEGCRKPSDGAVDACLLAEYGRRNRL